MLLALVMAGGPAAQTTLAKKQKQPPATMLPLRITDVVVRDGQLVALGTLGSNTFEAPITLTTHPNAADPDCPILDLSLGPIHLDLLGLNVDTSAICVNITAHEGGGLLGDRLCGISGLLDDGLPLGAILGALSDADLGVALDGITDLLNSVLTQATAPAAIVGVSDSAAGVCDILNLSLGPIDLNLLGLEVTVDDCNGGPVTIDVTADPGGGLLGDLLCSLDDLLNSNANNNALVNALNHIADAILALIG